MAWHRYGRRVSEATQSQPDALARDSAGNRVSNARFHSTPFVPLEPASLRRKYSRQGLGSLATRSLANASGCDGGTLRVRPLTTVASGQACITRSLLHSLLFSLSFFGASICHAVEKPATHMIVLGAAGESDYGDAFRVWGARWEEAFRDANPQLIDGTKIESEEDSEPEAAPPTDRERILQFIQETTKDGELENGEPRWLVLIGHGTHDASGSKFNLRGPDLTTEELSKELAATPHRWIIINCSSSSGPFLASLSASNRVVITSTKSGAEQNYSRFGDYLSKAILDPASDLDHDSSISVLEAFLAASSNVARFYREEGRLATEQALLDDNGDKRGTPASFFRGLRPVKAPAEGLQLDGELAQRLIVSQVGEQTPLTPEGLAEMEKIEEEIAKLRREKGRIDTKEYYARLETLLMQLAKHLVTERSDSDGN